MQDIIISANPYEELLKFSVDTGKDYASLDFMILGFETICEIDKTNKHFSEKELVFFDDDLVFLNESLKISQHYKIQIKELSEHNKKIYSAIKLESNKDETSLILRLDLSDIKYQNSLAMDILQGTYKKMIKEGYFLSIRIFDFKKKLRDSLHKFKDEKIGKKELRLQIARGVKRISAEDEKLILCYQDKMKQRYKNNKISIIGVKEAELVFKHIKPGNTRKGRSLKLDFIEPRRAKENKIDFVVSQNYEEKKASSETRSVVNEYFAKKSGFVSRVENRYDIENELTLSNINFRETGFICAGLDTGVSLNIKSTSEFDEAVGSGVHIECENINIEGNVAGNTTIKAKNLKIHGRTHSKSSLYAENAYISLHKGSLEATMADIDSLENAFVKALVLKVKKCLGSKLEAKKIYLSSLASNNNIKISQIAVIEHMQGSNNKFLVSIEDAFSFEKKLQELNQRQDKIKSLVSSLQSSINSSRSSVEAAIKQMENLKEKAQKIPMKFFQMVKDYQASLKKIKSLNKEDSSLKLEENELLEKIQALQESIFEAKIINTEGKWTDMNEIKFKFVYPKNEFLYSTRANDNMKLFILQKDLDNSGKIQMQARGDFNEEDLKW